MTPISKLRRKGTWQLGVFQVAPIVEGADATELLLVVDTRGGELRALEVLADRAGLPAVLERAARAPDEGGPARPRSLQCPPELAALARAAAGALGCGVTVDRNLPALDAAARGVGDQLLVALNSLPTDPDAWRAVLEASLRARPWEALSDDVLLQIRCDDPDVDGHVVSVLGQLGEQRGFVVFASEGEARAFFHEAADASLADLVGLIDTVAVHIVPVAQVPAARLLVARGRGLVVDGFLVDPVLLHRGQLQPLPAEGQAAVLACLRAVLQAFAAHGPGLALVREPVPVTVPGLAGGRVQVLDATLDPLGLGDEDWDEDWEDWDDDDGPVEAALFDDVPFRLQYSADGVEGATEGPTLIVKCGAADARRIAEALDGVDGLEADVDVHGTVLLLDVWVGERRLVPLLAASGAAPLLPLIQDEERLQLCIAMGGAGRAHLTAAHIVARFDVAVRLAGPDPSDAAWAVRDPDGVLQGGGWDGPMAEWPAASAVLIAFAAPLRLASEPAALQQLGFEFACGVWNAVVRADHAGDPEALDGLHRLVSGAPVDTRPVAALVERKRALFGRDSREMAVKELQPGVGELIVRVQWTPSRPR